MSRQTKKALRELTKEGVVHGVQEPGTVLAKVRLIGRWWVRVWAKVTDHGAEVARCWLFPNGGTWSPAESYVL